MILPAGVTKGTGLLAALDELGLSPHNAIAAGDAENDPALLQAAEVGAAVASAVPSLAAHAHLRLGSRNGSGVAELLTGPLLNGEVPPDHELAAVVSVLEQRTAPVCRRPWPSIPRLQAGGSPEHYRVSRDSVALGPLRFGCLPVPVPGGQPPPPSTAWATRPVHSKMKPRARGVSMVTSAAWPRICESWSGGPPVSPKLP